MTPVELAPRFFLAVVVILLVCRGVSWLLGRVGQPPVVGEMVAGVLLGPSLLGLFLPGVQDSLFPDDLRPVLYVVGQVGLVLLMFHAGHAFTTSRSDGLARTAAAVSLAGVTGPLVLGVALVLLAAGHVPLQSDGVPVGVVAAFVGVALAITAFPMLARIITERGQAGTRHGTIALASGAVDDVVAWVLLAVVLAVATGSPGPALLTVGGALVFVAVVVFVARPGMRRLMGSPRVDDGTRLLGTVAVLFGAAWFTDEIGLYAVFGAFALGLALPRVPAADRVVGALTPVTGVLVPLFFTYSGLHTQFGLFTDPTVLLFAVACVVLAIAGKFGACWAAARRRGEPQGVALRVASLMNARGLMQLIALNIGLEAGIVGPALFTVLVLVALVTTVMTSPLLSWVERRHPLVEPAPAAAEAERVTS
ncbi:cation:proton antiporter [Cellulomonas sp. zg-ZUI199]|uniref:Cation:proton antiporter n=1 Tax=Cellulomonas wangleii TaxID=2816956 RepID=A0ABX8D4S3_9CELL|nr:cation:proton antiporter [Cellulomonas wangleii]MBO0925492.1 cation:proton antiporter [Cellulomonas wangleii]QVI61037.1 cation:proton antiporter [Cellulomonas wangleii]